jgi:hypothetical protein
VRKSRSLLAVGAALLSAATTGCEQEAEWEGEGQDFAGNIKDSAYQWRSIDRVTAVEANAYWKDNRSDCANQHQDGCEVVANMGPTASIACAQDPELKKRYAKQGFWYVAVSDSLLARWTNQGKLCDPGPNGVPSCNNFKRDFCGKIVEIRPRSWGKRSLLARFLNPRSDQPPVRNAMGYSDRAPAYKWLAEQAAIAVGGIHRVQKVPGTIYAVINDFCPKEHKDNGGSECQGAQVDLGPGPWFAGISEGKVNPQGYLEPDKAGFEIRLTDRGLGDLGPR